METSYFVTFFFDEVYDTFSGEGDELTLLTGDAAYTEWLSEFTLVAERWQDLKAFEVVRRTVEGEKQTVVMRLTLHAPVSHMPDAVQRHIYDAGIVSGDIEQ